MSNIPSRAALDASTPQLSSESLPREYRVTGTTPQPARAATPRKATAGIDNSTLFFITLGIHGILIGIEVYIAYKSGWLG